MPGETRYQAGIDEARQADEKNDEGVDKKYSLLPPFPFFYHAFFLYVPFFIRRIH